jgi:hypothetical protein
MAEEEANIEVQDEEEDEEVDEIELPPLPQNYTVRQAVNSHK